MTARRKEEQLLGEEQNAITLEWDREKEVSKQQQEVSERKYREMLEKLRRQSRETKVCSNNNIAVWFLKSRISLEKV